MIGIFAALLLAAGAAPGAEQKVDVAAIRADSKAAANALEAGDYSAAAVHLEAARLAASRLALQTVASRVAAAAPAFAAEESRFALAASSTLQFDRFLRDRETHETRFINPEGKIVVVRVFGAEDDMKDFMFIADKPEMLRQAALEKGAMPGGPVLKRRLPDGGLSVLLMSEKNHALIEVEGATEADVMAVIDAM